ncbi:MAG: hypothetical protein IPH30_16615 [Betaproteobacteria bacterium]|nr:hypothetical protein [Betaproteobacteria bacterium]
MNSSDQLTSGIHGSTHYNYFRDYEPSIGRYVQSDPIGLRAGLNTYAYVDSNPLIFDDPLGLQRGGRGGPPIPGDLGRQPYVPDYWRKDYYRDYRDGYFTRPCIEYSCPTKEPLSCTPSNPTGGSGGPTSGPFLSGPNWSPGNSGCVCVAYGWQWQRGLDKVPGFSHRAGI